MNLFTVWEKIVLPKEFSFRKLFEAFLRNVDFGLNVRSVKYSEFSRVPRANQKGSQK